MSKKNSQQFVAIARDNDEDTVQKIEMIQLIMRKMAYDKGQKLEERCLTLDEYQEELKAQAEEKAKQKQRNERELKERAQQISAL